jgi:membrane protease YdiL (CAAX protease family)
MNPIQPAASGEPERIDPNGANPPPKRPFTIADVFLDGNGLRAIWGIALFLLLRETLSFCVVPFLQALFPPAPYKDGLITPQWTFVFEGGNLLCLAAATWLMALIEQRPVSVYGFSRNRSVRYFLAGTAWGVALLSLMVFALHASGLLLFDARLLFGRSILSYGFIWFVGFLLVALSEEVFLRGYLQFTLTRCLSEIYRWLFGASNANILGFWTAAAILSFVFGFGHSSNGGESPIGLIAAGIIGLVFCLSLWRTGSLWWAIGFHAAWDWAQSFLYGVADSGLVVRGRLFATHPAGRPVFSGGLTGPEGSIYILPVVVLVAVVILLTLPRTHTGSSSRDASNRPTALDLA